MPTGDYGSPDYLVGIEYKRDDLVTCIFNETLDKQLRELRHQYEHPYLFIGYDGFQDAIISNPGTNPDSIVGKITSVLARHHMPVVFVGDLVVQCVCDVIEKHYDGKSKVKETEYTPIRKGFQKRKPTPIEIKVDIISRIPGLGAKKGYALLEHFDFSLQKISQATTKELTTVPRIGDVLARHIIEVLQ